MCSLRPRPNLYTAWCSAQKEPQISKHQLYSTHRRRQIRHTAKTTSASPCGAWMMRQSNNRSRTAATLVAMWTAGAANTLPACCLPPDLIKQKKDAAAVLGAATCVDGFSIHAQAKQIHTTEAHISAPPCSRRHQGARQQWDHTHHAQKPKLLYAGCANALLKHVCADSRVCHHCGLLQSGSAVFESLAFWQHSFHKPFNSSSLNPS